MAKNNPFLSVDKLRIAPTESGAGEVIPESTYDQTEPLTSYKLGPSTMAVDMTAGTWPNTGKGVVNTSKASADIGTQTFQPFGSSLVYQRRWDATPLDFSDTFDGDNGSLPDADKWDLGTGADIDNVQIQNNHLRLGEVAGISNPGVVAKYIFPGDLELVVDVTTTYAMAFWIEIVAASQNAYSFSGADFSSAIGLVKLASSGNYRARIGGAYTTWAQDDWGQRLKITRNGSTNFVEISSAPIGTETWTLRASGTHSALNGEGRLRIFHQYPANFAYVNNYELINTITTPDVASGASWQDWITVEDAVAAQSAQETYADTAASTAVSTHNDTTTAHGFDLATFVDATAVQNQINAGGFQDATAVQNQINAGGFQDATAVADAISTHNDTTTAHGYDLATFITADDVVGGISVSSTEPSTPSNNDIWIDTSE